MIFNLEKLFWNMLDWSEQNKVDPGDTAAMIRKSFANSDVDWKKAKIYDKILENHNPFQKQELALQ